MHLLHCSLSPPDNVLQIRLVKNVEPSTRYAILSHRWLADELTFQDVEHVPNIAADERISRIAGYAKIAGTCVQACREGLNYVWVDTCCIDKTSSAELSEAINSMYSWYEMSQRCYVFLSTATADEDPRSDGSTFRTSEWFTRGWTLQELLAPMQVVFYDKYWREIGTKTELAKTISQVTGIREGIIRDGLYAHKASVGEKMHWASRRETTREEDKAYCLLGLFSVNLPPIYGEGGRAFHRLQREILAASTDQTIFAWTGLATGSSLLADSPAQFTTYPLPPVDYEDFVAAFDIKKPTPEYDWTNAGLRMQIPVRELPGDPGCYEAFLACGGPGWLNKKDRTWRDRYGLGRRLDDEKQNHWPEHFMWTVIYIRSASRRRGDQAVRYHRTRYVGCWVGQAVDGPDLRSVKTKTLLLALDKKSWPLCVPGLTRQPSGQSDPTEALYHERYFRVILEKEHSGVSIVDAWPRQWFADANQIHFAAFPNEKRKSEDYVTRYQMGKWLFPSLMGALSTTEAFICPEISFIGKYSLKHHLAAFVVDTNLPEARMLVTMAARPGGLMVMLHHVSANFDINKDVSLQKTETETGATLEINWQLGNSLRDERGLIVTIPFSIAESSSMVFKQGLYYIKASRKHNAGSCIVDICLSFGVQAVPTTGLTYDGPLEDCTFVDTIDDTASATFT